MDYTQLLILACIFVPLERLLPLHEGQALLRRQWLNDVVHLVMNGFAVRFGFVLLAGAVMAAYARIVPEGSFAWVAAKPLWVQLPAAIVIADLGYYTAHRIAHAVPFLWKFHAIHHSIEELDWLASHRLHPVDQIFSSMLQMLPLYFLGFSFQTILIFQALYTVHAILLHSNVRMNFGPLKYVFASPEHHHWHHADEREAYDQNFASQLSIIDVVGGTLFMPARKPQKYGLSEPMPETYPQQMLHPFKGLAASLFASIRHKPKVKS